MKIQPKHIVICCLCLMLVMARDGRGSQLTRECTALLYSDLVVRGTVVSVTRRVEQVGIVMPMLPTAQPELFTEFAEVRLSVEEIMRGSVDTDTIGFVAYVTASIFRDNYEPEQRMVVGLTWGENVLGGSYWMSSDSGRFLLGDAGWYQQEGKLVVHDLEEFRMLLAPVSPLSVLALSDLVVIGDMTGSAIDYPVSPEGEEYALMRYRFVNVEALKGGPVDQRIEVKSITSGNYWPDWRIDETSPHLLRGTRYCLFLKRVGGDLFVMRGANGAFEVRGNRLFYPGRSCVDLTTDQVREHSRP